jgi:ketosteroid isomerase-like protein
MAEESTTPDLVELVRQLVAVVNKRDLDATMAFFALDAVWDARPGIGTFVGRATIRSFFEDWFASYEEWEHRAAEVHDFGNAVTFGVFVQKGRLVGSSGELELRYAAVAEWEDGSIARITNYGEVDEGRAAAERLAGERE